MLIPSFAALWLGLIQVQLPQPGNKIIGLGVPQALNKHQQATRWPWQGKDVRFGKADGGIPILWSPTEARAPGCLELKVSGHRRRGTRV